MDVVTAFLNGKIEEELYMELPEEFEATLKEIISKHENDQKKGKKWKKKGKKEKNETKYIKHNKKMVERTSNWQKKGMSN